MPGFQPQSVSWRSIDSDEDGLEFARLEAHSLNGTILRVDADGQLYRVTYRIEWNENFETQQVRIASSKGAHDHTLELFRKSTWCDQNGSLEGFNTCTDIDLWPTPFTNSLPIKRINLGVGQSADIDVLWIKASTLEYKLVPQRYTRLDKSTYRFEERESGFTADLVVDEEGLVRLYPELFERMS